MILLTAQPESLNEWWAYYMERAREQRTLGNYRAARRWIYRARQIRHDAQAAREGSYAQVD